MGVDSCNMNMSKELNSVIAELSQVNDALAQASNKNDSNLLAELLGRVTELERLRNHLISKSSVQKSAGQNNLYSVSIPLRDQVIRALHLTKGPASGRLLSDITKAKWGERIESTKLSSLRRDESRSWSAGQDANRRTAMRDVYIVPALTYDRFAPVRGVLALSSWQLSKRLIAPYSPRVNLLNTIIALAEDITIQNNESQSRLKSLLYKMAATIPRKSSAELTVNFIVQSAQNELEQIEEIDRKEREAAAERASVMLDPGSMLFGAPLKSIQKATTRG